MKIYMLCDMEGISGICTAEHCGTRNQERAYLYQEGRKLLTADINSAAAAALEAGVDELYVNDTHGGGRGNMIWSDVLADPRITYETLVWSSALMPSLDESFDGLILLGHHAMAGTLGAFLDHTMSGSWFDFQINGMSVGEIGIETCIAGHWNVPLVMVQGCEKACEEAERQFPGVVTAAVKRAVKRERASGPAPELARRLTAEKVREAITKLREGGTFTTYKPDLPMLCRFVGATTTDAESRAFFPGVHRIDARTIECCVERQCDVLTWMEG